MSYYLVNRQTKNNLLVKLCKKICSWLTGLLGSVYSLSLVWCNGEIDLSTHWSRMAPDTLLGVWLDSGGLLLGVRRVRDKKPDWDLFGEIDAKFYTDIGGEVSQFSGVETMD